MIRFGLKINRFNFGFKNTKKNYSVLVLNFDFRTKSKIE